MSRESFAYGAAVLLITNLINRVIAFAYRILIVRLLGTEGVGLYEMVFPIYSLVLVVATAGFPLAVAKLTAEKVARGQLRDARRSFKVACALLLVSGLLCSAGLWLVSPWLATHVLADPRAGVALILAVPALLVVPLCSAFRGLFQGISQLSRPAISQVFEQVVRVAIGIFLALYLMPLGLDYAAGGLMLGMVFGEFAGFAYLLFAYWKQQPFRGVVPVRTSLGRWTAFRELWHLGFPVTIGRVAAAVVMTLEAVLIPMRLQAAGYPLRVATEMYGQFAGVALTLLHLPTVLTISLATAMVPAVAEATARYQPKLAGQRISDALRLSLAAGMPFAICYLVFPHQLTSLVFNNVQAGDTLRILALGAVFVYLQQTSTGILQGLGRVDLATGNLLFSSCLSLGGIYWLTALPQFGIKGSALAMVASSILGCLLNLRSIAAETGLVIRLRAFASLGAGAVMALTSWFLYRELWLRTASGWALLAAALCGTMVYLIICRSTGAFVPRDLGRLPWLGRWFRI